MGMDVITDTVVVLASVLGTVWAWVVWIVISGIAGILVGIHSSWLIILGLFTWILATGRFPQVLPGLSSGAYLALGLVAALLFAGAWSAASARRIAANRQTMGNNKRSSMMRDLPRHLADQEPVERPVLIRR